MAPGAIVKSPPRANWRRVWITGASTGIGREIAVMLAQRGIHVVAFARSADKLAELSATSGKITSAVLDVSDLAGVRATMGQALQDHGTPDLVILNAAVWHPMDAANFDAEKVAQSVNINVLGVTNCLDVVMPAMIRQGSGRLAFVASVAGYRGLPNSPAYAPTKAALISLAESLHADLSRHGVAVSIINPGFIDTPMTSVNTFPMPFIMPAPEAAQRIIKGLEKGRYEIAFPWPLVTMLKIARVMPNRVFLWWVRRFILKSS